MKRHHLAAASAIFMLSAGLALAQPAQTIGDGSTGSLQNIGDVDASKASSNATQVNPSANNVGNGLTNASDIRSQINPNIDTTTNSSATGAILGNNSNATATNGPQTMGQANTGTSSANTGASTATTGASTSNAQGGGGGGGGTGVGVGLGGTSTSAGGAGGSSTAAGGAGGTSSANGTNTSRQAVSAGNGAGAGAGSNNPVTVQGATDQSRTTYTAWANPVIHGAVASAVPVAGLAPVKRECGPRFRIFQTAVRGVTVGPFGGHKEVILGYKDNVGPWLDENGNLSREPYRIDDVYETYTDGSRVLVGQAMVGMELIGYASVVSTSSAQSFSLGIFDEGRAGQGGASGSGAMQQQTQMLNGFECIKAERAVKTRGAPPPPATEQRLPKSDRG